MKKNFDTALDECVDQVRNDGADIEDCLARYPEFADEMRGLLETTVAVRGIGVPEPSHQGMDQGRERLLKAVAERRLAPDRNPGFLARFLGSPALKWGGALAGLALLLLVGTGVALASGDSLPGDALYPVKRGMEEARLALTPTDAGKASRHIALAENRAQELAMVAPTAEPENIESLSRALSRNLTEAQRLGGSLTKEEDLARVQQRLDQSARTNLALLEGSLGNVPEESRAVYNDAFQLSSRAYAEAVETTALRGPAPLMASMGFLQLRASDPPAPPLDNVFVEVEKIEAHLAAGNESGWITIVEESNAFDLLRVEQIHRFLGQQEIPAGTYTQIRFEIAKAVVVAGGEAHLARVPSGKLSFHRPFTVREGETTVVTIDFDGQRSVQLTESGGYILAPNVKLLVNEPQNDGGQSSPRRDHASGKKIEIEGIVETPVTTDDSNDRWIVVDGQRIRVTHETEVEGALGEGIYVEAEVVVEPDGSFTAAEVEIKEEKRKPSRLPKVEIEGTIEEMNGNIWTIDGYTVLLSGEATWEVGGETLTLATSAEIEGDPQIGNTAEVKGLLAPDGTVLALEIGVEDEDGEHHHGSRQGDHPEHRDDGDHMELTGVIAGLSGTNGPIESLSAGDVLAPDWVGHVAVELEDGATFYINEHTEIEGTLREGEEVEVEILTATDGRHYARHIEVEEGEEADGHEGLSGRSEDGQNIEETKNEEHHPRDDNPHNGEEPANESSESSPNHSEGSGGSGGHAEELRYEGTLHSYSEHELVLFVNGQEITFRMDTHTELEVPLELDMDLRVDAIESSGHLIAEEVKAR